MFSVIHGCQPIKSFRMVTLTVVALVVTGAMAKPIPPSPDGGGWLELSRPNGYAYAVDHPDFDERLTDGGTIEMWVYLTRPLEHKEGWVLFHKPESYSIWVINVSTAPDSFGEELPCDCTGSLNVEIHRKEGGGNRSGGLARFPIGRWNHVELTYRSHYATVYINREWIKSGIGGGNGLFDADSPLYIGGSPRRPISSIGLPELEWDGYTGGLIDGFKISNRQIVFPSDEDVSYAEWRFDGIRSKTVTDSSPGSHTLRLVDARQQRAEITPEERATLTWGDLKRTSR